MNTTNQNSMDPIVTGALISAGSSILDNLFKGGSQKRAERQNIKFWNMQNAYNHPAEQMKRLLEAGLNPNLVYGQGVQGATGKAESIAPSKASPVGFKDPLAGALALSQVDLNKSNSFKANEEGLTTNSLRENLVELKKQEALKKKWEAVKEKSLAQVQRKSAKNQIAKIAADLKIADETGQIKAIEKAMKTIDKAVQEKGFKPDSIGYLFTNGLGYDLNNPKDVQMLKALFYSTIGISSFNKIFGKVSDYIGPNKLFGKPAQKIIESFDGEGIRKGIKLIN